MTSIAAEISLLLALLLCFLGTSFASYYQCDRGYYAVDENSCALCPQGHACTGGLSPPQKCSSSGSMYDFDGGSSFCCSKPPDCLKQHSMKAVHFGGCECTEVRCKSDELVLSAVSPKKLWHDKLLCQKLPNCPFQCASKDMVQDGGSCLCFPLRDCRNPSHVRRARVGSVLAFECA